MSVLLLDFEASGLDPKVVRTLEIGSMIVDHNFVHQLAPSQSMLVWESGYPPLTEEVSKVTGITQDQLLREAMTPGSAFNFLGEQALMVDQLDFVIAYNKQYDETLFREEVARLGLKSKGIQRLLSTPWLCAARDVPTNPDKMKKLMYLALDYGVTVNPKELHRAINDVELMRQMLVASGARPHQMYEFQHIPWVTLNAIVSFDRKDEAKKLGYSWEKVYTDEGEKTYPKKWVKRIKQTALEAELKAATFETQQL